MARTPSQRGTFGNWLKRKREERYRTQADALAEMRRLAGLVIAPSEYAQWESGSRVPKADNPKVERLFEFFGGRPEEEAPTPASDDATVVAAIDRQTVAIEQQTAVLQLVADGMASVTKLVQHLELQERERTHLALLSDFLREHPEVSKLLQAPREPAELPAGGGQ